MTPRVDSSPRWQTARRYSIERVGGCLVALIAFVLAPDPIGRAFLPVLAVGSLLDDGSVPGWFVFGLGLADITGAAVSALRGLFFSAWVVLALVSLGAVPFVRRRVPVADICAIAAVVLVARSWLGLFCALAVLIAGAGVALLSKRARFPVIPYAAVATAVVAFRGW